MSRNSRRGSYGVQRGRREFSNARYADDAEEGRFCANGIICCVGWGLVLSGIWFAPSGPSASRSLLALPPARPPQL